ncbi:hypothetical protein JBE27_00210 [Streptomyces albiflaviniger]|nr:hypothetical protein [Streptomyces albiflaviniger]
MKDQGRVEHARMLRDERRPVYQEFWEAAEKLADALKEWVVEVDDYNAHSATGPDWEVLSAQLLAFERDRDALVKMLPRVAFAGPREVRKAAVSVCEEANGVLSSLLALVREDPDARGWQHAYDRSSERLTDAREDFIAKALDVLESPPL